ncbi:MAG: peptide chain release factor N(5)-glutamine methyltransferase [Gemmatimonadota bacterium]|nr:MAG: peptide chain release factor N(5)-glutamine methyltransferase [Gemmatimonadota bacterium]
MSEQRPEEPPVPDADIPATPALPSLKQALARGRQLLGARSGDDASREASFLLTGVLGTTVGEAALQGDRRLSADEWDEYQQRLARRARGEPLQYIEGRAAFRQLLLRVDRSVLIPRPETEQLVEHVLDWCRGKEALVGLDLGTGCGAIALSLAQEGPFESVVAVDISGEALNVARVNASEAGVAGRVDLRLGSLFEALRPGERFHVIVSNPPYVAEGEAVSLPEEVRDWEPAVALFAGPTGMEVISEIVEASPGYLRPGGLLAFEVAPTVADPAVECIRKCAVYGEPRVAHDLAGQRRVVLAELGASR